jgi:transcriptional regulator with XRE-family HTH domain
MNKPINKEVCERVKKLRLELKLNQTEFGKKVGISRSMILNIELYKVEPKELTLEHICEIYNVNEDWLKNGMGEMFNPDRVVNKNLEELNRIFDDLKPEYQTYILKQVRELLEMQKNTEDKK